jgi:hypothetical protein
VASPARAERPADPALAHALAPRAIDGAEVVAWPRRPLLDAARAAVGAEVVWTERGTRGAGATICVLDTGVDLASRDFLDAEGRTRVRWLLDLDGAARGAHAALEHGGGAVWSRDELDAALAGGATPAPDWNGHGTSVASAAAGDDAYEGERAPGLHAGLAPDAELVVVRALRRGTLGLADDDLVRGARFCVDPRVSAPERTVVVLALGGHDGPHDGSSPLERALSEVAGRGAAVVVAAGNDGARAVHASARLVRDEPVRLSLRVPAPETEDALVSVVVRGARALRVTVPGADAPSAWVEAGTSTDDGTLRIDASPSPAAYVVWRGRLRGGELVIEARGPASDGAALDAWLVDARLGPTFFGAAFEGEHARAGEEVTVPATADGVVSVGASVSRGFLPGDVGPGLTLEEDEAGRATFSARGPRVDGVPLPTLLAPGGWMIAALSGSFDPDDPEGFLGGSRARFEAQRRGLDRVAVAGTSVAAGVVAGAIALARAIDARPIDEGPSEGGVHDEVALLAASAGPSAPSEVGPFAVGRGAGLLSVPRYVALRAGRPRDPDAPLETGCTRTRVVPSARDVAFVARSAAGGSEAFDVVLVDGARELVLARAETREGWAAVPLALPPLEVGREVRLEARGRSGSGRGATGAETCVLRVVSSEGSMSAPVVGGAGGCAVSPRGARARSTGAWPGVLLVLALAARARRARAPFGNSRSEGVP